MARADPPSATLRVRLAGSCFILADYDCGHASHSNSALQRTEPCASATARERGEPWFTRLSSATPGQGLRRTAQQLLRKVSLAGIEPVF